MIDGTTPTHELRISVPLVLDDIATERTQEAMGALLRTFVGLASLAYGDMFAADPMASLEPLSTPDVES